MEAADDVNLGRPLGSRFQGAVADLVQIVAVGARLVRGLRKRAELAAVDADVGMVDMAVDVEKDPPAVPALVGKGGQLADGDQVGMVEEEEGVVFGEALPGVDFCGNMVNGHK